MGYIENDVHNLSNEELSEVNGSFFGELGIDREWYAKTNYILCEQNETNEQYQFLFK